jgi:hypothetical protein
MTSEWDDFILSLSNMNSSVARMIASEMLFPVYGGPEGDIATK